MLLGEKLRGENDNYAMLNIIIYILVPWFKNKVIKSCNKVQSPVNHIRQNTQMSLFPEEVQATFLRKKMFRMTSSKFVKCLEWFKSQSFICQMCNNIASSGTC